MASVSETAANGERIQELFPEENVGHHFLQIFYQAETLPHLLLELVKHYPEFPYAQIVDKHGHDIASSKRTIAQIAHQAVAVVEELQRQKVKRGDRVMLVFFPSVEFLVALWACFIGGFVAVTVPPPIRLTIDLVNFNSYVSKAGAKVALSHNAYFNFSTFGSITDTISNFIWSGSKVKWPAFLDWVYIDKVCQAASIIPPHDHLIESVQQYVQQISRDSLAYMQLTSGSTSQPKMVMIPHDSAIDNVIMITKSNIPGFINSQLDYVNYTKQNCPWVPRKFDWVPKRPQIPEYHRSTVLWPPHFHDLFIFHLSLAVSICTTIRLMSPADFIAKPMLWMEVCKRTNATLTCTPNFGFDYLISKSTEKERKEFLDSCSPSWKLCIAQGGEPVKDTTLKNFYKAFPVFNDHSVWNSYGMAEAVAGVSVMKLDKPFSRLQVSQKGLTTTGQKIAYAREGDPNSRPCYSCGLTRSIVRPGVPDSYIIIVDPDTLEELPFQHIGEVWVTSYTFGSGYWGWDEADSAQVFGAVPKLCRTVQDRKYLRTGDRGFVDNGHVYIIGRYKSTLILRGKCFEPSDIEYSLWNSHDSLRPGCTVALSVPNDATGTDDLVLVTEVRDESLDAEIFEKIAFQMRESLGFSFGLLCAEILFYGPKKGVLKTTSGKPRRNLILQNYVEKASEPLYTSKSDALDLLPMAELEEQDQSLPADAVEKIKKMMEQLRRGTNEEEGEAQNGYADLLDEPLSNFSVSSQDMIRIQSMIHTEFKVYIPSGVLLQVDPNMSVRHLFLACVFNKPSPTSPTSPTSSATTPPKRVSRSPPSFSDTPNTPTYANQPTFTSSFSYSSPKVSPRASPKNSPVARSYVSPKRSVGSTSSLRRGTSQTPDPQVPSAGSPTSPPSTPPRQQDRQPRTVGTSTGFIPTSPILGRLSRSSTSQESLSRVKSPGRNSPAKVPLSPKTNGDSHSPSMSRQASLTPMKPSSQIRKEKKDEKRERKNTAK